MFEAYISFNKHLFKKTYYNRHQIGLVILSVWDIRT